MKFTITKDSLAALTSGKGFRSTKDTQTPAFGYTQITADDKNQHVILSAQHSLAGFRRSVPAKVEAAGKILLPHGQVDLIEATVDAADTTISIPKKHPDTLRVMSGKSAMLNLQMTADIFDAATFPKPPKDGESWVVDRKAWRQVSSRLSSLVKADDPGRPQLMTVHCHPKHAEATDGNQLVRLPLALLGRNIMVPASCWPLIFGLLASGEGKVVAKVSENGHFLWLLSNDGWGAFFRLADGIYPDVDRVLMWPDEKGLVAINDKDKAQSWTMRMERDVLSKASRLAATVYAATAHAHGDTEHPYIGFRVDAYGTFIELRAPSTNKVEVKIGEPGAAPPAESIQALSRIHLDAARLSKVLDAGFHTAEHISMRWTSMLYDRVQLEADDGSVSMIAQVKA